MKKLKFKIVKKIMATKKLKAKKIEVPKSEEVIIDDNLEPWEEYKDSSPRDLIRPIEVIKKKREKITEWVSFENKEDFEKLMDFCKKKFKKVDKKFEKRNKKAHFYNINRAISYSLYSFIRGNGLKIKDFEVIGG